MLSIMDIEVVVVVVLFVTFVVAIFPSGRTRALWKTAAVNKSLQTVMCKKKRKWEGRGSADVDQDQEQL